PPTGHAPEHDPGSALLVRARELFAQLLDLAPLQPEGLAQHGRRHRLVRDEQERLERSKESGAIVQPSTSPCHLTSISPNVSACSRSTFPSRYSSSSARNRTTTWMRSRQSATRSRNLALPTDPSRVVTAWTASSIE